MKEQHIIILSGSGQNSATSYYHLDIKIEAPHITRSHNNSI